MWELHFNGSIHIDGELHPHFVGEHKYSNFEKRFFELENVCNYVSWRTLHGILSLAACSEWSDSGICMIVLSLNFVCNSTWITTFRCHLHWKAFIALLSWSWGQHPHRRSKSIKSLISSRWGIWIPQIGRFISVSWVLTQISTLVTVLKLFGIHLQDLFIWLKMNIVFNYVKTLFFVEIRLRTSDGLPTF